jgi:putative hydrolase of the HAD superfamily
MNETLGNIGRRPKAVLFDLDDTLYDSTRLSTLARKAAVEAMVEAGLPGGAEAGLAALQEIVRDQGSNHGSHFNLLVSRLAGRESGRIVAAGIVAYHNTKHAYLRPFPDTVTTLLALRDAGCKLGVVTNGLAVKQWEKLIRMGLQHVFHAVVVSETLGVEKPAQEAYGAACEAIGVVAADCWFVGNDPVRDWRRTWWIRWKLWRSGNCLNFIEE